MSNRIAIQGDQASFHDIAARQFFGKDTELVCCDTFKATFAALKSGQADYAVSAFENSLYGSINEIYDLLLANDCQIIGEVYLRIEQCLIGLPDAKVEQIKTVYSHPVALAQCEDYLNTQLPEAEREEYHDTAAAVVYIKELNDPTNAAIASQAAAELYGMKVLAHSIETNKENYTRFIVLGKPAANDAKANKTSMVVRTSHFGPGALYDALGAFAKRNINLAKLQSRPIVGLAWRYMFYIDAEAGLENKDLKAALSELKKQGCTITVLGSYQAAEAVKTLQS